MRTTLNLDDDLVKAAKIAAIREGVTLTALVEAALRERIDAARTTEWEIPAHIDRDDPAAVAEFIAYMESKKQTRWTRPHTSKAALRPELDFTASGSRIIEALEGPLARP